jgi:histidine ammonia-lyase
MLVLDGDGLTLDDVVRVARERHPVRVGEEAIERARRSRAFLERCVADGQVIYGVNTGIGQLAHVAVAREHLDELQGNIVRSHAAGFGPPLGDDEVRAILLLKLNLFAKGRSGVRVELVRAFEALLRADVLPVVPAKGSLGASGDLAPLAHVALCLLGEGDARFEGRTLPAGEALRRAGLAPFVLSFKEGLGIINGCQLMAARGTLLLHDARVLWKTAQAVSAAVLDALGAAAAPFAERVHAARPYPGQRAVAANLRKLLAGERTLGDRVQDAYSLRCVPQILGGIGDAFDDLERRLAVEINAASDNPLVFAEDEEIVAAGNFHGESLSLALDLFGMALAEIASLAERQVNRLLNPALSGLPPFLAQDNGRNSGLMILQYTAASLVSENRVLAHPASVDSIPVSADQEDHVPMGATSAHKAAQILENVAGVLGIAAICAAQALDLRAGAKTAPAVRALRDRLRRDVPFWARDRYPSPDMRIAAALARSGELLAAVEAVAGELEIRAR